MMKMEQQVGVTINMNNQGYNSIEGKGKKDEGFTTIRISNETARELKLLKILHGCNGMDSIVSKVVSDHSNYLDSGELATLQVLRRLK